MYAISESDIHKILADLFQKLGSLSPRPSGEDYDRALEYHSTGSGAGPVPRKIITIGFNAMSEQAFSAKKIKAYLADLPERLNLERWIAYYKRLLHAIQEDAPLACAA